MDELKAVNPVGSSHDHGNCELCDHIDREFEKEHLRTESLESEVQRLKGELEKVKNDGANLAASCKEITAKAERLAEVLRKIADDWQADQLSKYRAKGILQDFDGEAGGEGMSFSDADLKQLKENLYPEDGMEINYVDSFVSGDSRRALVARLEAAELARDYAVMALYQCYVDDCICEGAVLELAKSGVINKKPVEVISAWRRACDK